MISSSNYISKMTSKDVTLIIDQIQSVIPNKTHGEVIDELFPDLSPIVRVTILILMYKVSGGNKND